MDACEFDPRPAALKTELITIEDAARMLGVDRLHEQGKIKDPKRFVCDMVRRADLESRKVGRFRMVVKASVERILEGRA